MGLLGKHPGLRDTLVVQLTPPLPSFTLRPNKDHRRSASAQGSGIHPPSLNAVQASKQNRERERQRARQRARARETDRERVREIEGGGRTQGTDIWRGPSSLQISAGGCTCSAGGASSATADREHAI